MGARGWKDGYFAEGLAEASMFARVHDQKTVNSRHWGAKKKRKVCRKSSLAPKRGARNTCYIAKKVEGYI